MSQLRRTSLRRRLTALCSLLTIAALALTGFDSFQRERHSVRQSTLTRLQMVARMIALQVRSSVENDDTAAAEDFLRTVTENMALQAAAVYLQDGRRFAVAGDATLLTDNTAAGVPIIEDWLVDARMQYVGAKTTQRYGMILVRASDQPNRTILRNYLRNLIVTDALALLALGLTAHWLLTRLLRPISTLIETTHQVRHTDDYSLRASGDADDEIGVLVQAFNAMLEAIEERDAHLADNAERLERQVQERTAELSRALDAAEAATRAKTTFLANMSHEIRTPLNAILGMTELAMDTEDPHELREYLSVIRSAGSNLLGILCDILDLSKIESDKLEISPVATDIEALVLDVLRPLTARIQSKALDLSFELAPELASAYLVDDVRLRQILNNLVGNAIKFTSEGRVKVSLRLQRDLETDHELELVVEDTGVGIPSDRLAAIFTPFTQADATITRRFAGTGLGLSITDRLVRLMGGRIQVESTVGVGTTFHVFLRLPICESPLAVPPELPPDTRVILVSRSQSLTNALSAIGRRRGVPIVPLAEARSLPVGPQQPNDCILVDERDPDRDADLCELVPIGPRGVRPVFVITSFQDLATTSARCRNNQFAGYLTKPVSGRELLVRLAGFVRPEQQRDKATPAQPMAAALPDNAQRLRVLVAEDNPVNQKLIERILIRDGHVVTIAENGRVCCEVYNQQRFDVVLMDMQMPEMSGLEATQHIRRQEQQSGTHVPIVALTANTTIEDRRACLDAGMDEVLPKPVSIPKLRAVLARFGGIEAAAAAAAVAPTAPPP